ncbi:alpha-1,6-rhamnosyltransferase, partial [Pseudomonas aeruginosa]|nr:alpha-1,6-rhamnosyltransferase [Pseudomonas aeruginosa]
LDFDYLLGNAYVCGAPVSLYRMEALRAAGFYDPEIKVQDFQMTLRIASQGYQIHKLPVLVTRYRRHPDNLSRRYKVLLDADLRTIEPYQSHPAYERGRTELVNKALKYAVVADKRHAWQLLRSLPLRQWNRTTFRRLKRFLLHHETT